MAANDTVTHGLRKFLSGSKTGEDGLVYKETTFSLADKNKAMWKDECVGGEELKVEDRKDGGEEGRSLLFLARKYINMNLRELSVQAIEGIPWEPFGKVIWRDAVVTYGFFS
jgi:hypothetical protein